jgi:hypothetical protein
MEPLNVVKKAWTEPRLVVHGDVTQITQQQNKGYGESDGFMFLGVPITNISN